ncbi:MAG: primosomal protein N' [Pseudomonadota bacterium]
MTESSPSSNEFFDGHARVGVLTTEPLDKILDYKAPPAGVQLGAFVEVPLGPRKVLGVVWNGGEGSYALEKLRTVSSVVDCPPMRPEMRAFLEKTGAYTMTAMSAMLRMATRAPGLLQPPSKRLVYRKGHGQPDKPTPARQKVLAFLEDYPVSLFALGELAELAGVSTSVVKGLVTQGVVLEKQAPRDVPYEVLDPNRPAKALTQDQSSAAERLIAKVATGTYSTTLLKGVTGSGKTEVYLEAVAECLRQGKQALVLIPEIALTVEFLERLKTRFGHAPAEWHSAVTQAERRRCWHMVGQNAAQVVVGARSALYLPFHNLGLIVIDEEHDASYKQEDGALYSARDMGVMRASIENAAVILASATPALETWVNAREGKYDRVDLAERYGAATLPDIRTIDMREEALARDTWISPTMRAEIDTRLQRSEQSLLFLNRRGYAPITQCRVCGHQLGCYQCDARMVEHRFRAELICHQCGYSEAKPKACPACGVEDRMAAIGPGVERLAQEAAQKFPDARISILSSDMSLSAAALKQKISDLANGAADIIIGTQLVAKGHNFPLLTLVGVIDADLGLQGADLRAAERTFQLMRQVAGRAGRADKRGVAYLQSYQPQHPVIEAILSGEEEAFWATEAKERNQNQTPPFGRLVGIVLSGPDHSAIMNVAGQLLRNKGPLDAVEAQLYGPADAPISRVRGRFRVRFLIKVAKSARIQDALTIWRASVKLPNAMRMSIDIDPQSFY